MQICCLPGVMVNPLLHTPHTGGSSAQPASLQSGEKFLGPSSGAVMGWAPGTQQQGRGDSLCHEAVSIQGPGWVPATCLPRGARVGTEG